MIELVGLTKRFGALEAVHDLHLTIPKGELFCFLGPNGAGKTTTMKVLTGLLRPTHGTARINGLDIGSDMHRIKREIGYIPDMPFLYERLTISEFMQFTGYLYDVDRTTLRSRTDALFELFDLGDQRSALIKDLSHGMRQRLIYCSTFLHTPSVLFIDEPLIGLDPYSIRLIKDLLREKARQGTTIFLTTHILALAQDIADRIGIILNGKLVELGTLSEIRQRHGALASLEDVFLGLTSRPGKGSFNGIDTVAR